ncbi:MAG: hypothetical protein R3E65_01440 [Steroidobacteraceae bacterium]
MTGRATTRGEPALSPQEAALRARVRAALEAAPTPAAPEFATLWQRAAGLARQASGSAVAPSLPYRFAAIAAGLASVALVATLVWQRSTPDDAGRTAQAELATDLQLAQALAARAPLRTPTDALLDNAPDSLLRGGPALPAVDYPLLPEEKYL